MRKSLIQTPMLMISAELSVLDYVWVFIYIDTLCMRN